MSNLEFADVEDFDEVTLDLEDELYEHPPEPIIPTVDNEAAELEAPTTIIDYSTRGPNDVVLSGPLIGGWGPGRPFKNRRQAYIWAATKYGSDRVQAVQEVSGRWAYLVKNLRST